MKLKKQEGVFLGMLLGTLGASMLGKMLARKGVVRPGKGVIIADKGYSNMNYMNKNVYLCSTFKLCRYYLVVHLRN